MKNIQKPTIYKMFILVILSIIKSNFFYKKQRLIKNIGQYDLIKPIKKSYELSNFFIGIYKKNKKKYFIKTWEGKFHDLNYYSLINEYLIGKNLENKLSKTQSKIKVPTIVEHIETRNTFSVVFEYIPGKLLSKFSKEMQVSVLINVLNTFDKLTRLVRKNDLDHIQKRSHKFYIYTLPLITFFCILFNPKCFMMILTCFISSLKETHKSRLKKLTLAHRDLNQDNIMIYRSNVYILDLEKVVLTVPNYDLEFIYIKPETQNILKIIKRDISISTNIFLRNYISLHNIVNSNFSKKYKSYYLEKLQKYYS